MIRRLVLIQPTVSIWEHTRNVSRYTCNNQSAL